MKPTLTILALFLAVSAMGQEKAANINTMADTTRSYAINLHNADTIKVIAYCLTDTANLTFEWKKIYGLTHGWVSNTGEPYPAGTVCLNGLWLFPLYLMPDRKTPVNFKVIYSVLY